MITLPFDSYELAMEFLDQMRILHGRDNVKEISVDYDAYNDKCSLTFSIEQE